MMSVRHKLTAILAIDLLETRHSASRSGDLVIIIELYEPNRVSQAPFTTAS